MSLRSGLTGPTSQRGIPEDIYSIVFDIDLSAPFPRSGREWAMVRLVALTWLSGIGSAFSSRRFCLPEGWSPRPAGSLGGGVTRLVHLATLLGRELVACSASLSCSAKSWLLAPPHWVARGSRLPVPPRQVAQREGWSAVLPQRVARPLAGLLGHSASPGYSVTPPCRVTRQRGWSAGGPFF